MSQRVAAELRTIHKYCASFFRSRRPVQIDILWEKASELVFQYFFCRFGEIGCA